MSNEPDEIEEKYLYFDEKNQLTTEENAVTFVGQRLHPETGDIIEEWFGLGKKAFESDEPEEELEKTIGPWKDFDECVQHFMSDPDFKPKGGRDRKEAAQAACAEIERRQSD